MNTPNPSQMMEAHVRMNLGVYFDDLLKLPNLCIVTSKTIPDFYWNYAYSPLGSVIAPSELDVATSHLTKLNRGVAIWQPADVMEPHGWNIQSEEAWMWLEREEWQKIEWVDTPAHLNVREHGQPDEVMRAVFEDAYSSGEREGDIGYFRLPQEYGRAYMMGHSQSPTLSCHFSGWLGGQCVAIATATFWNRFGGIYSVATSREHRSCGFATKLSRHAARWAFNLGAHGVLLQTSANSPVEQLYYKLGFRRVHVGALLTPNTNE